MPVTRTPALMIQGTGSNVGKSLIVAGLCRLYARSGLKVAPFKPQNMSNNAAVAEGGEIGRAQALQARAARIEPTVDMNPVLLKPESERGAQVIVRGTRWATLSARDYARRKGELLAPALESFTRLGRGLDLVLAEGAGSPAEINLRPGDIANMGFAEAAGLPVAMIGDIDRGGVIASLVGTHAVLDEADRARVAGFIVNRFRGDPALFGGGMAEIERRTGWPALGLVPHFAPAHRLPAEDTVDLASRPSSGGRIKVAVPRLPRIANFDDLDPLRLEPAIDLVMLEPGEPVPGDAGLVVLAGSKATIADLAALREAGWDIDIAAHVRRGGLVIGLCGGYQMLGRTIRDAAGLEGSAGETPGLGLLAVETELAPEKAARRVAGRHIESGAEIAGYEIHLGRTDGPDRARPLFEIDGRGEGARSADGRVIGSYLHGAFAGDRFRAWLIARLGGAASSGFSYEQEIDAVLDRLADHLDRHLDRGRLLAIARTAQTRTAISP